MTGALMEPKWSQNWAKEDQNGAKNDPKLPPKLPKNGPKLNQKRTRNGPKNGPKNRPKKIDPKYGPQKWIKNGSKLNQNWIKSNTYFLDLTVLKMTTYCAQASRVGWFWVWTLNLFGSTFLLGAFFCFIMNNISNIDQDLNWNDKHKKPLLFFWQNIFYEKGTFHKYIINYSLVNM